MQSDILLIDDVDITGRISEFDVNIEPSKLRYSVLTTQDKHTRSILGDELYFDFVENYDNNTLSPEYETLYPYIKNHLIARSVERILIPLTNQITNKGPQNRNSDYSINAGPQGMYKLIDLYTSDAEFYETRLWKFIRNNKEDYPLWEEKSDDINKQKPGSDYDMFML